LINKAERPLIIAGHGITIARAEDELCELVTKAEIPVTTTLLGKSCIAEDHELALGMIGMHGQPHANQAIQNADLIIVLGMRFSDRDTGALSTFAPHADVIHIDIDPAEIGKNVRVDVPVVGDAKEILSVLNARVEPNEHPAWLSTIKEWRFESKDRDILSRDFDVLLPQYVIQLISEATEGDAVVVSDVGQNQMWEAQYYMHRRRNSLMTSGGLGTMGFALPAAIGVQLGRPDEVVWAMAGDGGFQMNIQELATVAQEGVPIKMAILNNGYLGMVRQWQQFFFESRYSGTPLSGPDFVKVAEAYGIMGLTVDSKEEALPAIQKVLAHNGPALIDFRVVQEENVYPMVKPGDSISQMIRRPKPEDTSKRSEEAPR
jgi:acetolactate synthase-1/2/3 large subunit